MDLGRLLLRLSPRPPRRGRGRRIEGPAKRRRRPFIRRRPSLTPVRDILGRFRATRPSEAARERVLLAVVLVAVGVALLSFETAFALRPGTPSVRDSAPASEVCKGHLPAVDIDCPPADPDEAVAVLRALDSTAGHREELLALAAFAISLLLAHAVLRTFRPRTDPTLLPAAALLSGIGLVLSFRLAPDLAVHAARSGFAQLGWRHLVFAVAGPPLAAVVAALSSERLLRGIERFRWLLLGACAAVMGAIAVGGMERNGVRLVVDVAGFVVQPVEFIKVGVVVALAAVLARREDFLVRRRGERRGALRPTLLLPVVAGAVLVALPIFVSLDLGPVGIIGVAALGMIFCATGKWLPLVTGFTAVFGVGLTTYLAGWPGIVRERVDLWLEPFQRNQTMAEAAWSLAGSGPWGTGLGQGLAYRVPEVQSDFTFTAWVEETGLVGCAVLLGALLVLVGAGMGAAVRSRVPFHRLAAAGIALLITVQAVVIVAGNLGIVPLTGVTLPFTSYGGSGLLANYLALGLLLGISHHARNLDRRTP